MVEVRDDKFWARVKIGAPDECWEWQGYCIPRDTSKLNYGLYRRGTRAHRYAYTQTKGIIPTGMCVCHTCDNPPCCNPAHLWLGTYADNNRDRAAKGRTIIPGPDNRTFHGGQRHGKSKLTDEQARAIARDPRIARVIAPEYGISPDTVNSIKTGDTWSEVTGIPSCR